MGMFDRFKKRFSKSADKEEITAEDDSEEAEQAL